ncbi:MAG: hypothetical protein DRP09_12080 [Candidatus Thorarchaeota archaeon]|nr:MAG: hypothetical protein DRP09_12080 [Candidatus Thorarchaeota archaeon]
MYFKNKYERVDAKAFESEFAERFKGMKNLGEGVSNVGQFLYLRKTGSDFARERRRSVRVALDDWVA